MAIKTSVKRQPGGGTVGLKGGTVSGSTAGTTLVLTTAPMSSGQWRVKIPTISSDLTLIIYGSDGTNNIVLYGTTILTANIGTRQIEMTGFFTTDLALTSFTCFTGTTTTADFEVWGQPGPFIVVQ